MVYNKVPRVFILAGCVLILLVLGNSYYLYDDRTYHATSTRPYAAAKGGGEEIHQTSPEPPVVIMEEPPALDQVGSDAIAISQPIGDAKPGTSGVGSAEPSAAGALPAQATAASAKPAAAPAAPATPATFSQYAGGDTSDGKSSTTSSSSSRCPALDFVLRAHQKQHFSSKVRYNKVCIQPVISADVDRNAVAPVPTSFFGDEVAVDLDRCETAEIPECIPVSLQVPPPHAQHNVAHLMFGIATDYSRLKDASTVNSFAHWLSRPSGDGAKLVALITDYATRKTREIQELQRMFQRAGINVEFVGPIGESYTTSESHFAVLAHMLNNSNSDTQWYGLLDDDTFFPRGLKPLSDALAGFDHSQDYYVGALSEDFQAVRNFGFMAFGGAGIYLSAPLARTLGNQLHKCIEEATASEGDIIIRDCVYSNSKAKLTILPGLYQQDMKGEADGFFESGVEAINLHHWKSWYQEPVVKLAAITFFCGDCFLQRWRIGDDTIFTNGYSIAKYLYDVDYLDLNRMEGTWWNANRDFDFSIGPLRRPLVPEEKKSYKLKEVHLSKEGDFRQLYVWEGTSNANEADGIIEVVWNF